MNKLKDYDTDKILFNVIYILVILKQILNE